MLYCVYSVSLKAMHNPLCHIQDTELVKKCVVRSLWRNLTSFTRNIDIIGNILKAFRIHVTQPSWLDGEIGYGAVFISKLILIVNIHRGVRY